MRCIALFAIAACQQSSAPPPASRAPTEVVDVELKSISGIPHLLLSLPAFAVKNQSLPAAHVYSAGSLGTGFMTNVIVRSVGSCFPRTCNSPIADERDRRTQRCTEPDQVTVYTEHTFPSGNVCCIASWTQRTKPTTDQLAIATAIENACATLRLAR